MIDCELTVCAEQQEAMRLLQQCWYHWARLQLLQQ
jgi:hypothetical protein